jgi:hypothetical protein
MPKSPALVNRSPFVKLSSGPALSRPSPLASSEIPRTRNSSSQTPPAERIKLTDSNASPLGHGAGSNDRGNNSPLREPLSKYFRDPFQDSIGPSTRVSNGDRSKVAKLKQDKVSVRTTPARKAKLGKVYKPDPIPPLPKRREPKSRTSSTASEQTEAGGNRSRNNSENSDKDNIHTPGRTIVTRQMARRLHADE